MGVENDLRDELGLGQQSDEPAEFAGFVLSQRAKELEAAQQERLWAAEELGYLLLTKMFPEAAWIFFSLNYYPKWKLTVKC